MIEHDEVQADIPAYVASRLEGEARRRVEAHLAECETCSEIVFGLKGIVPHLTRDATAVFDSHPDAGVLMDYGSGRVVPNADGIAHHVRACASCELEVEFWRRRKHVTRPVPARSRVSRFLAPATGLAVGMLLGLMIGILYRGKLPSTEQVVTTEHVIGAGPSTKPHLNVLSGTLRGGDGIPRVRRLASESRVLLALDPALPDEAKDDEVFRFEIRVRGRNVVWSDDWSVREVRQEIEEATVITLSVPTVDLPEGDYELIVTPRNRSGAQPNLALPFRVE